MARPPHPNPWSVFTRRWLLEGLRTLLWVTVITVLIWTYADLQFTDTRELTADLTVTAGQASGKLVVLSPTEPIAVKFNVSGNRYQLDRFAEQLRLGELRLRYDAATQGGGAAAQSEQTADLINRMPEVRKSGLEVTWAQPKTVEVVLDELKSLRNVPVKLEYTGAQLDDTVTRIEPPTMDILFPASLLKGQDLEKLTLPTQNLDLSQAPAGETVTKEVPLQQPANGATSMRLPQRVVRITYRVLQKTNSQAFRNLPIRFLTPRSWEEEDVWSTYKIDSPPSETWTRDITVVGNKIDLEKLRKEDIQLFVQLSDTDKNPVDSWLSGKIYVHLPPELKLQLSSDTIPNVQYKLIRRTETSLPRPAGG